MGQSVGTSACILGLAISLVVLCARYAPSRRWGFARNRYATGLAVVGFVAGATLPFLMLPPSAIRPPSFVIYEGNSLESALDSCNLRRDLTKTTICDHSSPEIGYGRYGSFGVADQAALLLQLQGVRAAAVAVRADTLAPVWVDWSCLRWAWVIAERFVVLLGDELLVFDVERQPVRHYQLSATDYRCTFVEGSTFRLVTETEGKELPREVWANIATGDLGKRGVSEEEAAQLCVRELEEPVVLDLGAVTVEDSEGWAVAFREGVALWDSVAQFWFSVYWFGVNETAGLG
jgi:hypothetical protein